MNRIMKNAFTMSELLLVIAILGVVAVLALPSLQSGIDKDKNVALLREAKNQIDAAFSRISDEYGSLEDACGPITDDNTFTTCVSEKLQEQLKVESTTNDSFPTAVIQKMGLYASSSFLLSNGMAVCTIAPPYHSGSENAKKMIFIDVDGPNNGTNTYGEDIFWFYIGDDGLVYRSSGGRGSHRAFQTLQDEEEWAIVVGNQDYLACPNELVWGQKETCK